MVTNQSVSQSDSVAFAVIATPSTVNDPVPENMYWC